MGELPFGHPGPNFDDTPVGFDDRPLNHWPEPDYTPDEVVHYAPAGRPVCGASGWVVLTTDELDQVAGCGDCLQQLVQCAVCGHPAAWVRQ